MTKTRAVRIVIAYFAVFFGAILLRIDYFPLTWVPMYGHREESPLLDVTVGDLEKRDQGFRATLADGRVIHIDEDMVNMPPANFRRLYNERMFGEGPPQHRRERLELSAFNHWWYETLIGPQVIPQGLYPRQVLDSFNQTLGLGPQSPDRIVRLEAEIGRITLTREQRDSGNFNGLAQKRLHAAVTPSGSEIYEVPAAQVAGQGEMAR